MTAAVPKVYPLKSTITLSVDFSEIADGSVIDPPEVNLYLLDPSQAQTVVSFPGDVIRDAAGVFHYDLVATLYGVWTYKFQGTGNGINATTEDITFEVKRSVMNMG
ncbi:MAG TPA: hypothetical protein VGF92_15845 [Stellaceae bacterium]|jgi:hypothetical protein